MIGDPAIAWRILAGAGSIALLTFMVLMLYGDELSGAKAARIEISTPDGQIFQGIPDFWKISELIESRRSADVQSSEIVNELLRKGEGEQSGEFVLGLGNGSSIRVSSGGAGVGDSAGLGGTYRYTYEEKGLTQTGSARVTRVGE